MAGYEIRLICTHPKEECPYLKANRNEITGAEVKDFCMNCKHMKVEATLVKEKKK